jgi:crotonobetaine/carnitine-CoA ligase
MVPFRRRGTARRPRASLLCRPQRRRSFRPLGENISAAEVEAVLRSEPEILEVAVVPVPDELRGEEVKAYVQLNAAETPEQLPPEALTISARPIWRPSRSRVTS